MNKYKPQYLGRIIPTDDESKLTDFVQHKFDAFTAIYDACKEYSDQISNVTNISGDSTDLSIKLVCSTEVMELIKEHNLNENLTVSLDVITARV